MKKKKAVEEKKKARNLRNDIHTIILSTVIAKQLRDFNDQWRGNAILGRKTYLSLPGLIIHYKRI